jgi:ribonuclease P protein component
VLPHPCGFPTICPHPWIKTPCPPGANRTVVHLGDRRPDGVKAKSNNGQGGSQRFRVDPDWRRPVRCVSLLRRVRSWLCTAPLRRVAAILPWPHPRCGSGAYAPPCWAASIDGEHSHQAHVPAEEALSPEDPRLPDPDVLARGAAGDQGAAPQGPQAADARARSVSLAVTRRHRLRGGGAFVAVREWRASSSAGPLRVQVAPNRVGVARVGFIIPRAVGGAVVRNRVRRRLRALMQPRLEAQAGLDVVVAAGVDAASRPWPALGADLDACLAGARARLQRGDASATAPNGGGRRGAPERPLRDNRGGGGTRPGRGDPGGSRPATP